MPIPKSQPFEKTTAKDRAYQQIKQWIIDGTLMPDEKLAEVDLAEAIDVSRTPIREALLKLNEDGFVTMAPGKVTRVTPLETDDTATLYEPMAAIEGLAAKQAAQKINAQQLTKLQQLEKEYQQAITSQKTADILITDRSFHREILIIADNPYEKQFSELLYDHIVRFETYFFKHLKAGQPHSDPHTEIIQALIDHQPTQAQTAMSQDWLSAMKTLSK